jgi:hypothetical protein
MPNRTWRGGKSHSFSAVANREKLGGKRISRFSRRHWWPSSVTAVGNKLYGTTLQDGGSNYGTGVRDSSAGRLAKSGVCTQNRVNECNGDIHHEPGQLGTLHVQINFTMLRTEELGVHLPSFWNPKRKFC